MPDSTDHPTSSQKKTIWFALTALAAAALAAMGVGAVLLGSWILGYLNPILVPVAVAGIIAYLLDPVIAWLARRGMKRRRAVHVVFSGFLSLSVLLAFLVMKPAVSQARDFWKTYLTPLPSETAETAETAESAEINGGGETLEASGAGEDPSWFARTRLGRVAVDKLRWLDDRAGSLPLAERFKREDESWDVGGMLGWSWEKVSGFTGEAAGVFGRGVSSATSYLGYLLGMLLVPVYLFFFLRESDAIARTWSNYLPLRQSAFKDELVGTLREINQYLIAYFRGQMVVSLIDGFLVAVALSFMGLDYALLLGVFLAILGLIPYLGNLMVMIPAVLIAFAQYSDPAEQFWGIEQVWVYPLIVVGIFLVLQQVNGLVTAPKIVGDSVGLHPLTVIFSILFWTLLLGGLLGALLAVPLTASVKVLFRRYLWERRLEPAMGARLAGAAAGGGRRGENAGTAASGVDPDE